MSERDRRARVPISMGEGVALARILGAPALARDAIAPETPALFDCIGLEARLGDRRPALYDLSASLLLEPALVEPAARFFSATSAPELPVLATDVSSGTLNDAVRALYVELERPRAGERLGVSVFAAIDAALPVREQRAVAGRVARLLGARAEEGFEGGLSDAIAALPSGTRAWQAGWMLGRASRAETRVSAIGPAGALARWAVALGWRGPDLRSVSERLAGDATTATVHAAPGRLDAIGIELAPSRERWADLLARLSRAGVVPAQRASAIAAWNGTRRVQRPDAGVELECTCVPSHVKVTVTGAGALRAKAYLALEVTGARSAS